MTDAHISPTQEAPTGKELTRERIMEAAEEVFAQKGYHDAAVDDIVEVSRTSKGSVYFHFPSKQEIFFALIERLADHMSRSAQTSIATQRGAIARVDAALQAVFHTFSRHRRLAKILLVSGLGLGPAFDSRLIALHQRFASFIKGYLDGAVAEGDIAPIDTEIASYMWLGAINEVVVRWLHTGQPKELDEALPALRTLLLQSICAKVESHDPQV